MEMIMAGKAKLPHIKLNNHIGKSVDLNPIPAAFLFPHCSNPILRQGSMIALSKQLKTILELPEYLVPNLDLWIFWIRPPKNIIKG